MVLAGSELLVTHLRIARFFEKMTLQPETEREWDSRSHSIALSYELNEHAKIVLSARILIAQIRCWSHSFGMNKRQRYKKSPVSLVTLVPFSLVPFSWR